MKLFARLLRTLLLISVHIILPYTYKDLSCALYFEILSKGRRNVFKRSSTRTQQCKQYAKLLFVLTKSLRNLIRMLLLTSGNVERNPGPLQSDSHTNRKRGAESAAVAEEEVSSHTKKRKQATLASYFTCQVATNSSPATTSSSPSSTSMPSICTTSTSTASTPGSINTETADVRNKSSSSTAGTDAFDNSNLGHDTLSNDVGDYVGSGSHLELDDRAKEHLLKNAFVPGNNFNWPHAVRKNKESQEKRYLRKSHFDAHPFLCYSKSKGGLFCRHCAIFAPTGSGKGNHQGPGKLVNSPVDNYARLLGRDGYLSSHMLTDYHKASQAKAEDFLHRLANPSENICSRLDQAHHQNVIDNRNRLKPIVKTIIFCGKQGLALRGHRDHGPLALDNTDNDGNFRCLLRFRAEAGDTLVQDIVSAPKNATYLHPSTQNELINLCGEQIRSTILSDLREAFFFTIMADETTDVSTLEQLTILVRFVHKNIIREEFLTFRDVKDLTGKGIAREIIKALKLFNIDLNGLIGQAYDGASSMSGCYNGVQAEVRNEYPLATYVHCASHCLNLVVSKSCTVRGIRNCIGTVSEVINHLSSSAKRLHTYFEAAKSDESARTIRLKQMCDTRWVERHDSVLRFCELYDAIKAALSEMSHFSDRATSSKSQCLLRSVTDKEFVIALVVLNKFLAVTRPLSISLQQVSRDIVSSVDEIKNIVGVIQSYRDNIDDIFRDLFAEAGRMLGKEITMPRLSSVQTHRENHDSASSEDYYKRSVAIPFVDSLITEMHSRFTRHSELAMQIGLLIPSNLSGTSFKDILPIIDLYSRHLPFTVAELQAEFDGWKRKWTTATIPKPDCPADTIRHCNRTFYPAMYTLLCIFCALPVTTASGERSFSKLKLLKTYLRNSMTGDRLDGLALMFVHREKPVSVEQVISDFANSKRRVNLVL